MKTRQLRSIYTGQKAKDGAGVSLTRMIGSHELNMVDPFLLFDVIESNDSQDYIGGFPSHPHRGFETVTYLLNGRMRHKDSVGNEGVIEAGGVQWMTAGSGIIHSELPEQEEGLLHGFQLWVNLPASAKFTKPAYQEYAPDSINHDQNEHSDIKVIAGTTNQNITGPVNNNFVHPLFLDVVLDADSVFKQDIPNDDNAFIYVISGELTVGDDGRKISQQHLGVLYEGDRISITAKTASRFLLIAARPLNEPVARGGPFVMNTREQVQQAFNDYQSNTFIQSYS